MSDEEVEANARRDPDNPPASAAWLARARLVVPPPPPEKVPISLRLDADVLAFFREPEGTRVPGYQTRINAVLRAFVDHYRRPAGGA